MKVFKYSRKEALKNKSYSNMSIKPRLYFVLELIGLIGLIALLIMLSAFLGFAFTMILIILAMFGFPIAFALYFGSNNNWFTRAFILDDNNSLWFVEQFDKSYDNPKATDDKAYIDIMDKCKKSKKTNKGKAIELRGKFTPRKVSGSMAIEINQYSKPAYNTIRFSLCNEEISGLFYKFCEDLVEQTRETKDRSDGYTAIINRYFQWKKLFTSYKRALLSEPEIMGLIGELLYLKGTLSKRIGLHNALKSWSGQELTHKDFSFDDTWVEVKTVRSGGQTVKISSLEQLDSKYDGELAVYSLEKMSMTYNGITLNKLIIQIRTMFSASDERDQFMARVALQGYEYNDYYDDFVYEISDYKRYYVSNKFPRLTVKDVNPSIKKATYEISLIELAPFEII